MKELKESGGSRVRKTEVEEQKRKAARLGMYFVITYIFALMILMQPYLTFELHLHIGS
jgi:hypothetical protein